MPLKRKPLASELSPRMKARFLGSNLLAHVAKEAVAAAPTKPNQSLVAIIFSCAFVEALVNDYLDELRDSVDEGLQTIKHVADAAELNGRISLRRKIQVLRAAAKGEPAPFGSGPLQRFGLLIDMRNWLVHMRPELVDLVENPHETGHVMVNADDHKIVKQLVGFKVIQQPPGNRMSTVSQALFTPEAAAWSYRTAYDVAIDIGSWLPGWRIPPDIQSPGVVAG
jgi:hypothetical protein